MKKIVLLLLTSVVLTSCSTTKSGTAKTIDIVGPGIIHKPVIVDLDVKQEKVSKTIVLKNVLSLDNAKNEAVRELLKESNSDVLVEPTFDSKTKNGKTELTVFGRTAIYKNFRQIEEKDIKFLEMKPNNLQKVDTYQPIIETKKGKGKGWLVAGGLLLVGAIVAGSI